MKLSFWFIISLISLSSFSAPIKKSKDALDLQKRLTKISLSFQKNQKILLGQQNAFIQGRGWNKYNADIDSDLKSDMHLASGIHPSVHGIDFLEIGDWNEALIVNQVKRLHDLKGITTLTWHMKNLVSDQIGNGSSWDKSGQPVKKMLPGGSHHELYKNEIKRLAKFLIKLKPAPVIFRPFHEHNDFWFWWGKSNCTKEEYLGLWKILTSELQKWGVDNLLYAYSPSYITNDYFERYPGDEVIDILGVDAYFKNVIRDTWFMGVDALGNWKKSVLWLMRAAEKRRKIPAITEFGQEAVSYENFWTDFMGWPVEKAGISQLTNNLPNYGIAYVMLWRNDPNDPQHFYGPIPGSLNQQNFLDLLSKGIFQGLW
jgi:mannan endo-1,4-beta-mannosidase